MVAKVAVCRDLRVSASLTKTVVYVIETESTAEDIDYVGMQRGWQVTPIEELIAHGPERNVAIRNYILWPNDRFSLPLSPSEFYELIRSNSVASLCIQSRQPPLGFRQLNYATLEALAEDKGNLQSSEQMAQAPPELRYSIFWLQSLCLFVTIIPFAFVAYLVGLEEWSAFPFWADGGGRYFWLIVSVWFYLSILWVPPRSRFRNPGDIDRSFYMMQITNLMAGACFSALLILLTASLLISISQAFLDEFASWTGVTGLRICAFYLLLNSVCHLVTPLLHWRR